MSRSKGFVKNSFFLLVGNIIGRLLGLLLTVFIARKFGSEGYGKYTLALAFPAIFAFAPDFGLKDLIIRNVARDRSLKGLYLGTSLVVSTISIIVTYAIIWIATIFFKYPQDVRNLIMIATAIILVSVPTNLIYSLFRAFERMELEAIIIVIEKILITGVLIFLIIANKDLETLLYSNLLISIFIVFLSLFILQLNFAPLGLKVNLIKAKKLIKKALPFAFSAMFVMTYFKVDTVMLSLMIDDSLASTKAIGLYNAAYNLCLRLMIIPTILVGAVFPALATLYKEDIQKFKKTYEKACFYLLILALPLGIGTTLLSDKIILLLYGKDFTGSVLALQILIWASSLVFLTYLLGIIQIAMDRQRYVMYITGFCAVLNILLNIILIPNYSYIGAAVATVITESAVLIISYHLISKTLYKIHLNSKFIKILLASSIMGIIIFYLKNSVPIGITIIVSFIVYFTFLFLFKSFSEDDLMKMGFVFFRQKIKKFSL